MNPTGVIYEISLGGNKYYCFFQVNFLTDKSDLDVFSYDHLVVIFDENMVKIPYGDRYESIESEVLKYVGVK